MSNSSPVVYTPELVTELRELVKNETDISTVLDVLQKRTGLSRDHVRKRVKQYFIWPPARVPTVRASDQILDKATLDNMWVGLVGPQVSVTTTAPAALEDVLKICKVDETKWKVKSFGVDQRAKGFAWRVSLDRKPEPIDIDSMLADFIARAESHAPKEWIYHKMVGARGPGANKLLEIACFDIHIGRLCWGKETGHPDYDIKIAPELVRTAVQELTEAALGLGIGRVLLPIGNDLLNSEASGMTTAGTPQSQSEDSRWKKKFTVACDLMVETIERLASQFPVDVLVVAGNHDREGSFYLGQYIKSWFRNHPNVTVNNEPTQRKYYRFGQTLIGLTHGSEEKVADLPGIMATERAADWGLTKNHIWTLGHQHRHILQDMPGCQIRHIGSLTPPDEWMAGKGYVGHPQAAEALVFDPDKGLVASFYHTV